MQPLYYALMARLDVSPLSEDEVAHLLPKDRRALWEAMQRLDMLAELSVEGEKVNAQVKAVLASLPPPLRALAKKAYALLQAEARNEWGITQSSISREQKKALAALKTYENPAMTALLSPSSLRQLRLLFLSQPELMASITVAGKKLRTREVGVEKADAPSMLEVIPSITSKQR
jgi:hypothetical protein